MYRKYEKRIQEWIDNSKKSLLIYGARQVGKTYLIREMLKRNNISFCEYNLIERQDILMILEKSINADDTMRSLALYSDVPLEIGRSVIFIDEIQEYPDIVTKIKFLTDNGMYRLIFSGSNLGVELKGIKSMPVGYVDMFQMYPLDFEEFAKAIGITDGVINHVKDCYKKHEPVDELIHKKLIQVFYYYLIVGGMPSVINKYNDSYNLEYVNQEQENIINLYKADFIKYEALNKRLKIISIYDNIPAQLNKQNRKFKFTMLNKEVKFDRYEDSFLWLKDAGVAIPVYITNVTNSPLEMSKETNVFKLFLSDVGLLTSCYPLSVKKELLQMNPEKEINNGALFENYVAQELIAHNQKPYYYKKKDMGEVDYLIETDDGVVPVEVKSGSNYKKHAALDNLIKHNNFKKTYVLSCNNMQEENEITYLPIYMTGLICDNKNDNIDYSMPPII